MKKNKSLFNILLLFITFLTIENIFANRQTTDLMPEGLKKRNGMNYEIKPIYYGIGDQNKNSISVGSKTEHGGEYSIAIGNKSSSEGYAAVTQGYEAQADGYASISHGYGAKSGANYAIAQGYKAQAEGGTSISIGSNSKAGKAFSIVLGNEAKTKGEYSIAIGDQAEANSEKSVAIGSNSKTTNAVKTNEVTIENIKYNGFAGNNPVSVVSIGDKDKERQLQNVAAGQISSTSTDAINGSQLYSTNKIFGYFASSVKDIFGSNANLDINGKITMSNIGGTSKNTIHDSIKENFDKNKETSEKLEKLSTNTLSFDGDSGTTEKQMLNKNSGLNFKIKGSDHIITKANGNEVNVDLSDKIKKDIEKGVAANSGIANAIAMANLLQVNNKGHNLSGSYAYYNGENAFALGFSGTNDNIVYRASGSLNTKGYLALGAGISYQFGGYDNDSKEKDTTINIYLERLNALNDKLDKQNGNICQELERFREKLKNYESIKVNEDDLYTLNGYKMGASELTSSQIDILRNIVKELNINFKNRKIYITGYTDNVSNENFNLELGLRRANKVAEKLRELGLDGSISIRKVSSSGYSNIVETNKNSTGRYLNRRVEIALR